MREPKRAITPADSQHYRELANKLRGIAGQSCSPDARQKIFNLASWYEVRANHLDTRGTETGIPQDAC